LVSLEEEGANGCWVEEEIIRRRCFFLSFNGLLKASYCKYDSTLVESRDGRELGEEVQRDSQVGCVARDHRHPVSVISFIITTIVVVVIVSSQL
jgi:hypothetical protein